MSNEEKDVTSCLDGSPKTIPDSCPTKARSFAIGLFLRLRFRAHVLLEILTQEGF